MDSLCSVLDLKGSRHARARGRRTATGGLDAEYLLQVASGTRLRRQLEPRHGSLPLTALGRASGGGDARVLRARRLAQLHGCGVEVEEGGRHADEEVMAADDQVARRHLGGIGDVELQGYLRERVEHVGVESGDAGCVVERCFGAEGHGSGGGVVGVARVVLGAAADCHVLEDEPFRWWREGSGRRCLG